MSRSDPSFPWKATQGRKEIPCQCPDAAKAGAGEREGQDRGREWFGGPAGGSRHANSDERAEGNRHECHDPFRDRLGLTAISIDLVALLAGGRCSPAREAHRKRSEQCSCRRTPAWGRDSADHFGVGAFSAINPSRFSDVHSSSDDPQMSPPRGESFPRWLAAKFAGGCRGVVGARSAISLGVKPRTHQSV